MKVTAKQKMKLKVQRLRKHEKRNKFYRQNVIFKRDAKKFDREIGKETITADDAPSIEEAKDFGRIYGVKEKYLTSRLNG